MIEELFRRFTASLEFEMQGDEHRYAKAIFFAACYFLLRELRSKQDKPMDEVAAAALAEIADENERMLNYKPGKFWA